MHHRLGQTVTPMMSIPLPTPEEQTTPMTEPGPDNETIVSLFSRLIVQAEGLARAQLRLYRAGLFARMRDVRAAIIMLVVAVLLALSSLTALLVGVIIGLAAFMSVAMATVVVVVGALLIAGLLAWVAISRLSKATKITASPNEVLEP